MTKRLNFIFSMFIVLQSCYLLFFSFIFYFIFPILINFFFLSFFSLGNLEVVLFFLNGFVTLLFPYFLNDPNKMYCFSIVMLCFSLLPLASSVLFIQLWDRFLIRISFIVCVPLVSVSRVLFKHLSSRSQAVYLYFLGSRLFSQYFVNIILPFSIL